MTNLLEFHSNFYSHGTKKDQDSFIANNIRVVATKRRRHSEGSKPVKPNSCYTTYFIRAQDNEVPVCMKTFINVLGVTRSRVDRISKIVFSNKVPNDGRGGDHVSHRYKEKKEAIIQFICSLKCAMESHYCRGKSERLYLPSEMNIERLANAYNSKVTDDLKVKNAYFRFIFNRNFNIGFGSPRVDVCSTCLELTERAKTDQGAMVHKAIHKRRAKAFFSLLRENNKCQLTMSFDCEKNLPCPKIPDQEAYYRRQLYLYNFTITVGHSGNNLTPGNVFSYVWTEDQHKKGSNEIASCVYHRLQQTDLAGINIIKLFADGCGGQNKNRAVVTMAMSWLSRAPLNVGTVEVIFPVRGHSFMPPDRVFGLIEKKLRKKEVIATPNDYISIIKEHSTVIPVVNEVGIYDWKAEGSKQLKPISSWHFKFNPCKRYIIQRSKSDVRKILVRGELFYFHETGTLRSIFKAKKQATDINPEIVSPNVRGLVKQVKLKDVEKLLTLHYGENWKENENLEFFSAVINSASVQCDENDDDNNESACEEVYEDLELAV